MRISAPPNTATAVDSTANATINDVIGNKEDAASLVADIASLVALARKAAEEGAEVVRHHHSGERWFGAAAVPVGETHVADRTGAGAAGAEAAPFIFDAGNDDWGAWGQFMGSEDTPTDGGSATHFDMHRIEFESFEHTGQRYMIQIALQEDAPADDPGAGDTYTEFEVQSTGVGSLASILPVEMQNERVPAGTKAWGRIRAPGQNTSTLSGYFGLHEYTDV